MSSPTRAFLKPLIFYPDSCEQGLKPPLETGNFGDRIYWFRVDGRPFRVKKVRGLRNIRIRACGHSLLGPVYMEVGDPR